MGFLFLYFGRKILGGKNIFDTKIDQDREMKMLLLFQHPNNKATLDLLWKYYERNGNFMAADKILMKLAEREGYELNKKPYIISFRNIFRFIMSRVRKLTVEVNAFRLGNRRTFLWGSQQPSFARFLLIRFDLLILTIFRPV